jgi:hypothetical protein
LPRDFECARWYSTSDLDVTTAVLVSSMGDVAMDDDMLSSPSAMDGGDDMYMDEGPAASQTISAADIAKLSESASGVSNPALTDPNGHLVSSFAD